MKKIALLVLVLALVSCNTQPKKTATADAAPAASEKSGTADWSLEELWATDTLMSTCESVLFDQADEQLIVSCINGSPWEKDGRGFMALLNLDGSIKAARWIEGLDGPKGSGISDGKLYVADITQVVVIDMARAVVMDRISLEGAQNLNDIAVDADGTVYISDSGTGWIWTLKDGVASPWIEGDFARPNGLLVEKDRVLLATSGSSELMLINKASREFEVVTTEIGHGDGIAFTGMEGHYLLSSWSGEVFLILPDFSKISLLESESKGMNTADIAFNVKEQILYVPTFFDNRVVAYRLLN